MSENRNLTIKGADKSGKIVTMDTADYIEYCELLLNDREFYKKLGANPTLIYTEEVQQKIDGMLKKSLRNGVLFVLAWVACFREWRASVGDMGGVLPWVVC